MSSASWPQSWELCAALLVPVFQELIRNRGPLRNRKQHIGFLKIKRSLKNLPFLLFLWKRPWPWVCLVWTIYVERHLYATNIITRTITNVTASDPILWVILWNHLWGSSPDNWSASYSAKVSKLLEEGRLLEKVSKIFFCNNCTFREALSCMSCKWNLICSQL